MKSLKSLLYKPKLISLYLFAASLGYEYWDPIGIRDVFTITKFFGLLYALLSFSDIKRNFAITKQNKIFVFSSISLWGWIFLITLLYSTVFTAPPDLMVSFLQVVILFWLVFNDISYNPKVKVNLFLFLVIGMVSISILLSLGIGIDNRVGRQVGDIEMVRRVFFLGMNPNTMGAIASLALLLVFYLIFTARLFGKYRYLLLLFAPNLLFLIGISGSRGAFFMLFLGIVIYFGVRKTSLVQKILYFIVGGVIIFVLLDYLKGYEVLQSRLTSTFQSGDTGGRLELWRIAWFYSISKYPFFGIGRTGFASTMERLTYVNTAHNSFIDFLGMGGIVGFFFLIIFFWRVFKNTIKILKINKDAGNLMIFFAVTFFFFKGGGTFDSKLVWLMLACVAPVIFSAKNRKTLNV